MRTFLTRKVSILGRSVPLALVLLGSLALVAFASWLVIVATLSANITSASFDSADLFVANYTKDSGITSTCTVNPSSWEVVWTGVQPGQQCGVIAEFHNDSPLPAILNLDKALVDPAVIVDDSAHAGTVVSPTGVYNYRWTLSLDASASTPGTAYNFTYDLTALPQ